MIQLSLEGRIIRGSCPVMSKMKRKIKIQIINFLLIFKFSFVLFRDGNFKFVNYIIPIKLFFV